MLEIELSNQGFFGELSKYKKNIFDEVSYAKLNILFDFGRTSFLYI